MLQRGSLISVADNTGVKIVKCIGILGGFFNKTAKEGTIVTVSVKQLRLVRRMKVGQVCLGVIIKTKKNSISKDGVISKYNKNSIVLLNQKRQLLGNKVFGSISRKLRQQKFMRIVLMSGSTYF